MIKIWLIFWTAFVLFIPQPAKGQTEAEIKELFGLLENGLYVKLVNKVCKMRNGEYYKNAFMDYCLAYGYCQLNESELASQWLDHILENYNGLSKSKRKELEQLKTICGNPEQVNSSAGDMMSYLRTMNPEGFEGSQAGVESKMGIPSLRDKVTEVDFEHLTFDTENRQFTQQEKSKARLYYKTIIGDNSMRVDSTEHLLIFYSQSAYNVKAQIKELEAYYTYYSNSFNLGQNNRLITVFYCSNRVEFEKVANNIHHMQVPKSTYGYASGSDLLMLGIADSHWLGALKHELFHLMIRSFVGDIPAWLDEGIACYFESSSLQNNQIKVNIQNYRTNVFKELHNMRFEVADKLVVPNVQQFTNYNWLQFSGNPGDLMIKTSLHYSISYAFVLYLAELGKLELLVDAIRNRTFETINESDNGIENLTKLNIRSNDEILTHLLDKNMLDIQKSFEGWLKSNLYTNPYSGE
jgi:hypothetical protein